MLQKMEKRKKECAEIRRVVCIRVSNRILKSHPNPGVNGECQKMLSQQDEFRKKMMRIDDVHAGE